MAESSFTPAQLAELQQLFIQFLQENGSVLGDGAVRELTPEELTDATLRALTIPSMMPSTEEWVQTSLANMMGPLNTAKSAAETATTAASNAAASANEATTYAENVNAIMDGMEITVTDRNGVSITKNIGFDMVGTYESIAAMNADAANVEEGKFVIIATTDPTSADNAKLFIRNSNAATSAEPFSFCADLDQASAAAWADWLNNMKPQIESAITTAGDDHTQAVSDHNTASSDHTQASSDHSTASTDHINASSDHTQAGTDHTRAEGDHTTASGDHTQAMSDHTTASTDHTQASTDHSTASTDHSTASTDHSTAESDHTLASSDHSTAESDHSTASSDHTIAGTDHTTAESDHATSVNNSTYAKNQGDYAKNMADHPAFIGDGITGDLNYWYIWNYATQQYVKDAYAKGDNLDWDGMTPTEKEQFLDEVTETIAETEGYAFKPVDVNTVTPSSIFPKNSIIGINGILYYAYQDTQYLPVTLVTEGNAFVVNIVDGRKAFVVANNTLNQGWKVFTDAGLDYLLNQLSTSLNAHTTNTGIHVTTSDKSTWNGKQDAISDLDTIRSNASKGAAAIQLTDTIIIGGDEYTISQLLNAVAGMMNKTIVVNE